jgi:hypothetical protein
MKKIQSVRRDRENTRGGTNLGEWEWKRNGEKISLVLMLIPEKKINEQRRMEICVRFGFGYLDDNAPNHHSSSHARCLPVLSTSQLGIMTSLNNITYLMSLLCFHK